MFRLRNEVAPLNMTTTAYPSPARGEAFLSTLLQTIKSVRERLPLTLPSPARGEEKTDPSAKLRFSQEDIIGYFFWFFDRFLFCF